MEELEFEWDDAKARLNFEKHGVTFEEAMEVFLDPEIAPRRDDRKDYGEDRQRVVGLTRDGAKTLTVIYTERTRGATKTIRIISAWMVKDNSKGGNQ